MTTLRHAAAAAALLCLAGVCPAADVTLRLGLRDGVGEPRKHGCAGTGGGTIEVRQVAPDTLVMTVSGAAAADGHPFKDSSAGFAFDVTQCFQVVFEKPTVTVAKVYVQGRAVGLLRSGHKGTASLTEACAAVAPDGGPDLAAVSLPAKSVAGGQNLSVNVASAPACGPIAPGCYTLRQRLVVDAAHAKCVPYKAATAEFAPNPALGGMWIGQKEPFVGASKKEYGFLVVVKVAPASADPVAILQSVAKELTAAEATPAE